MLSPKQEQALEAKLEQERRERLANKRAWERAAKPPKPLTGGALAEAMEADQQAARDGLNPKP